MPRNPIDPEPDGVGADLDEIADRILAASCRERGGQAPSRRASSSS
jgi:hypothetical protein